jgi:hypothetical protein
MAPPDEIKETEMCSFCKKVQFAARAFVSASRIDRDGANYVMFMVKNGDSYNLCEDFNSEGCPTREGIERADKFIARAARWGKYRWWFYHQTQALKYAAACVVCELTNHKLVDGGSSFGPDSGTECLSCTRCGWAWSHTYY